MLEHDSLIRLMVAFAAGLRRALELHGKRDNASARFALEETIGTAADMDPEVLLALEPASMAAILSLGAMDASAAEYIVHALMLEAGYLEDDGYVAKAGLRRQQARSVADAFGVEYDPRRLEELLNPLGAKDEEERHELEARYGVEQPPGAVLPG